MSKPIVPGNLLANASATGSPTYPNPMTAIRSNHHPFLGPGERVNGRKPPPLTPPLRTGEGNFVFLTRSDFIRFEPGLEHQDAPEIVLPVVPAGQMLRPLGADRLRREKSLGAQTALAEKRLRPIAQWSPQPGVQRDTEAGFRPLDEIFRHVPVEHLAQQPLALLVADL